MFDEKTEERHEREWRKKNHFHTHCKTAKSIHIVSSNLGFGAKKNEKILQFEMQFFHSTKIIFDRIFLEQNADGKEFIMSKYCSTNIRKNVSNSQKFRVGLKKSENFRMQIKFVYHFLFGIDFRGKFIPVTFVVSRNSFN